MEDLVTRAYRPPDAAAIADLANVVSQATGGRPDVTPGMVADLVAMLVKDSEADTRLVLTGDGTLAGFALVRTPPAGGDAIMLHGAVDPQWRGRQLGRQLLRWQLDRAAEIHRAHAPAADLRVRAVIMLADEQAARLFRRFGMTPARYWFDMAAPVPAPAADPLPRLPGGLRPVAYTSDHEPALHAAHMEVFADHWGFQYRPQQEWAELSVRAKLFAPELSLLAYDGDQLAGYVLSQHTNEPDRFEVNNVGVRRQWRRRGLAAAMLLRVLAAAGQGGWGRATLGVDADSPTGAVGVYERVGFTVEARAVTYETVLAGG